MIILVKFAKILRKVEWFCKILAKKSSPSFISSYTCIFDFLSMASRFKLI